MKLPTLLTLSLLAACACGRDAVPPDMSPPDVHARPAVDESEATRRALVDELVLAGHPADKIHVEATAGALGATRIHTRVDEAYPGDGLRTALVVDGLRYGIGGRDLAALARARGWHEAPPAPGDLARLVAFAWLPMMAFDDEVTPALTPSPDGLVLAFGVREVMSGDRARVVAAMPRAGDMRLETSAAEPPPAEPPADPVAALEDALTSQDALAMMAALRRMDAAPASPARTRALARAAVLPNEAIAFDALLRIGASDESAAALVDAVKQLDDTTARPRLVERARQAHGDAFARRLAP